LVFRWHPAAAAETLKNKELYDMLLDFKGALSAIAIYISATNGATYNKDNEIYKLVRKIEIKDGSKILHSVTGVQEQGLNAFDLGKVPEDSCRETPGYGQASMFYAMFGPKFGHPRKWLDLRKYKNPTLYVDWNLEEVRAVGGDSYVDATGKISIALLLDEDPEALTYEGYHRTEETRNWTTVSSGEEPVKLPVDWPIRNIMVRAYQANRDPTSAISKLKMDCDKGTFLPYEIDTAYLVKWINDALGYHPVWSKYTYRAHGEQIETPLSRVQSMNVESWGATPRIISVDVFWNGSPFLNLVDHAGATVVAAESQKLEGHGELFQSCMFLPFGSPLLEEPYFDAAKYTEIILKCTQGSAGRAASVVTQQLAQV